MNSFAALILATMIAGFTCAAGAVTNVIYVFTHLAPPLTGRFVAACIGLLVPPVGVIHGWISWFI